MQKLNLVDRCILLGLLLAPFATGTDSHLKVVVTFAWPIFTITVMLILLGFVLGKNSLTSSNIRYQLLGSLLALSALIAGIVSARHLPSLYRTSSYFLGFFTFIYLLSNGSLLTKRRTEGLNILMMTLAISGTLLALYYILHFIDMGLQYGFKTALLERTNQGISKLTWGTSNTVAGILNPFIFLTLYLAFFGAPKFKKYWCTCGIIILFATCLTLSRGGIISLFLGILLLSALFGLYRLLSYIIIAALILISFLFFLQSHFRVLHDLFLRRVDSYSNGRSDIWTTSLAWIHDHYTSMIGYYMSLNTFGHSSHNVFLTTFIERGLVGVLLILVFATIYLSWIINNLRSPITTVRVFYKFVLAATIVSWIHLQIEDFNFVQPYLFYSWCLLGLIFSAKSILSPANSISSQPHLQKGFLCDKSILQEFYKT